MLPEHLVPARFHVSTEEQRSTTEQNNASLPQGERTLDNFAKDILIGISRSGQPRNILFEEHDRHVTDRLFRAIKIETFAYLLNSLQAEGEVDAQALSQLFAEKTQEINDNGNRIWLNLITCEKDSPLFYSLEDE